MVPMSEMICKKCGYEATAFQEVMHIFTGKWICCKCFKIISEIVENWFKVVT